MIQNYVWNWHLTKFSIIHFMCNLVLFIGSLTFLYVDEGWSSWGKLHHRLYFAKHNKIEYLALTLTDIHLDQLLNLEVEFALK